MADAKLSALTAAGAIAAGDLIYGDQSAASVKVTAAQVKTFTSASPTLTDLITSSVTSANTGALVSTGYSLTGSNATNMVDLAGTWNTSGVATAFKLAITNTAVGAGAFLMNLLAGAGGATSQFSVSSAGAVVTAGAITSGSNIVMATAGLLIWTSSTRVVAPANGSLTFSNSAQTNSFTLSAPTATATPTMQIGALDAAIPIAQILSVQNVVAGTSNTAGADFTVKASAGTGTGAGGKIIFQTADAGSTGTAQNAFTAGMTLDRGALVQRTFVVANLPAASSVGQGARSFVTDASTTLILGLGLTVAGGGANKVPVFSDGTNWLYG